MAEWSASGGDDDILSCFCGERSRSLMMLSASDLVMVWCTVSMLVSLMVFTFVPIVFLYDSSFLYLLSFTLSLTFISHTSPLSSVV